MLLRNSGLKIPCFPDQFEIQLINKQSKIIEYDKIIYNFNCKKEFLLVKILNFIEKNISNCMIGCM